MNANLSLAEAQHSFNLSLDTTSRDLPKFLTAELNANFNQSAKTVQLQTARLALGNTTFQASGTLDPAQHKALEFNGNLALAQLSRLFKVTAAKISGDLQLNGNLNLDAQNNYAVNGLVNSRGLSVSSGTTHLSNVSLNGPFHADPYLISLDGLKLNVMGGAVSAKVFIEKMQRLSAEATLRDFSIPVLAASLAGHPLGYDGSISGTVRATGDLKAAGTKGMAARARLAISPGTHGVPLTGSLNADYNGAANSIDLGKSYVAMPNSRLDLSGAINKRLQVSLTSHNLSDFLPAANFGSAKPLNTLPIRLQGGSAAISADITGDLSAPHITAHASMDRFAAEDRLFDQLALDLDASQAGAVIRNGILTRQALHSSFDASLGLVKWQPKPASPLAANLTLRNADLADLLSLAGESVPRVRPSSSRCAHYRHLWRPAWQCGAANQQRCCLSAALRSRSCQRRLDPATHQPQ